jgi:glyceraldehyde-3-phosphate dehydrogenase (NADP+)
MPPRRERRYRIGGQLLEWPGPIRAVVSPVYANWERQFPGSCPSLTETESLAAVEAACFAWNNGRGAWSTMRVEERIAHVEEFARQMVAVRAEVVRLMVCAISKPLDDCRADYDCTIGYFRATVDALKDLGRLSSRFVIEAGIYARIRRPPLEPALCAGPYNYPLNETFSTLIAALIMSNPVIVKAPRSGKLLYASLFVAFASSFPPGGGNILFGNRRVAIPALASGKMSVLACIGSSTAADALRRNHPEPHRLRFVLGLDAKNAAFVLPCADMELTAAGAVAGALTFNGQRCTARKIFYVHGSRLEKFLSRTSARIAALPMEAPWKEGVKITPMPVPGKIDSLRALVADAVGKRAGGHPHGGAFDRTHFYPALIADITRGMRIHAEEQFGPMVPVMPDTDIEEAIGSVMRSPFGQRASLFGTNPGLLSSLSAPWSIRCVVSTSTASANKGRTISVHRAQGFGRGLAFSFRCRAGVFDPHAGGRQGVGAQQGRALGDGKIS